MGRIITSGILSFAFMLSMMPAPVSAATTAEVQAKLDAIKALQVQMQTLQTQMKAAQAQQKTAVAEFTALLRQGSSGEQVQLLQALLAANPDIYPEGLVTGYFGPATARAVKRFQKENGFEQVGNVGPKTLKRLQEFLRKNPMAFGTASSTNARKEGKRPCAIVPPGHLVAPGWLRKHSDDDDRVVPECQTLPPGIWDKLDDDDDDDDDRVGSSTRKDKVAPILSAIGSTVGATTATIVWTTNESSNSKIRFGTTTAYTNTAMNGAYVTAHSLQLTGLLASTLYHFQVSSVDGAGNVATSSDMTFTTSAVADTTAPVISSTAVGGLASTTATVTWSTNENATTKVYYSSAMPFVLGSASNATTAGLVTAHSQALVGLSASTTYSYVIESADSSGNTATTSPVTFSTPN